VAPQRPREWDARLAAGPVAIGQILPLVMVAVSRRIEDVHLSQGIVDISARHRLKTEASAAPVPVCPELAEVLAGWLPRAGPTWLFAGIKQLGPWTGGASGDRACDRLKAVGEELGVDGLTINSLRHTFATWSRRRWGLSGIQLRDVLRHTTEHTQDHYVHGELDNQALVESVRLVSYR